MAVVSGGPGGTGSSGTSGAASPQKRTTATSPSSRASASGTSLLNKQLLWQGPKQRVVLVRRGPGAVLGDDGLRERKLAVSCVASSASVLLLSVNQQRFSMCVDALTLRLFHKLKAQHGAVGELAGAVAQAAARDHLLDRVRHLLLSHSYDTTLLPPTLVRGEKPAYARPEWIPPNSVGSNFSEFISLMTGERAAQQAQVEHTRAQGELTAALLGDAGHRKAGGSSVCSRARNMGLDDAAAALACDSDPAAGLPKGVTVHLLRAKWGGADSGSESIAALEALVRETEERRAAEAAARKHRLKLLGGAVSFDHVSGKGR